MSHAWSQPSLFDAPRDEYAPPSLTADESAVLGCIQACAGQAAAIGVADLAERTGLESRRVQSLVKHLIEEHWAAIGTSTVQPFGYFWIVADEERRQVRDGLVRRALSVLRRARAYDRSGWVSRVVGQLELDLGGRD